MPHSAVADLPAGKPLGWGASPLIFVYLGLRQNYWPLFYYFLPLIFVLLGIICGSLLDKTHFDFMGFKEITVKWAYAWWTIHARLETNNKSSILDKIILRLSSFYLSLLLLFIIPLLIILIYFTIKELLF